MFEQSETDGVVTVRLAFNKVNALDVEGLQALRDKAEELAAAAAVVLVGTGSVFSAGVDLRKLVTSGDGYTEQLITAMSDAFTAWFDLPVPVVAAVNGHAIAGGAVLAGIADYRLMSGGRIGLTELKVGVPFPPAPLEIMRHLLGAQLQTAVQNAELYAPEQAVTVGFIDEVTSPESLLDGAVARARALADVPRSAYALTKTALRAPARARWCLDDDLTGIAAEWSRPEVIARIESQVQAK